MRFEFALLISKLLCKYLISKNTTMSFMNKLTIIVIFLKWSAIYSFGFYQFIDFLHENAFELKLYFPMSLPKKKVVWEPPEAAPDPSQKQ